METETKCKENNCYLFIMKIKYFQSIQIKITGSKVKLLVLIVLYAVYYLRTSIQLHYHMHILNLKRRTDLTASHKKKQL